MAKRILLFKVELETDSSLTIGVLSDSFAEFKHAVEAIMKRIRFQKHLTIKSIDWEQKK